MTSVRELTADAALRRYVRAHKALNRDPRDSTLYRAEAARKALERAIESAEDWHRPGVSR